MLGKIVFATALVLASATVSVRADCDIEITYRNYLNEPARLDKDLTKVRTIGPGFSSLLNVVPLGIWRSFIENEVTIPANGSRKRNARLRQSCVAAARQFKFFFASGSEVVRVDRLIVIPVDRKFDVYIGREHF